jgi:hypothetical protein
MGMSRDSLKELNEGAHKAHCCMEHGCFFKDKDCPVVKGESLQLYVCEACLEDGIQYVDQIHAMHRRDDDVCASTVDKVTQVAGGITLNATFYKGKEYPHYKCAENDGGICMMCSIGEDLEEDQECPHDKERVDNNCPGFECCAQDRYCDPECGYYGGNKENNP